jgi:hypothetical protein
MYSYNRSSVAGEKIIAFLTTNMLNYDIAGAQLTSATETPFP